jgi:hypothetical protein
MKNRKTAGPVKSCIVICGLDCGCSIPEKVTVSVWTEPGESVRVGGGHGEPGSEQATLPRNKSALLPVGLPKSKLGQKRDR